MPLVVDDSIVFWTNVLSDMKEPGPIGTFAGGAIREDCNPGCE
jgi:hypothetical protein